MPDKLKAALNATGLLFAEYAWSEAPRGDYGVYGMGGENDLHANDMHAERATEYTVDYFTRRPPAEVVPTIEAALESMEGCAWYLNSVQYENDSGYLHLEWVAQVV